MVKEILHAYRDKVNVVLEKFFDSLDSDVNGIRYAPDFVAALREFTMRGGKRVRPIIMIYGYKCFAQENNDIITASVAIELLESFFLVHDDIMDYSKTRRGKPTFHVLHGENEAILAGDTLVSVAQRVILGTSFDDSVKVKMIEMLGEIMFKTNLGQLYDLKFSAQDISEISEEDILQGYLMKTAYYTVEGPLMLGALCAGAAKSEMELLREYGQKVGVAFQLVDDILGIFGSEEKLGKSVFSDIEEGKKTVLVWHALQHCSDEERAFLRDCLGRKITSKEFERVKEIFESSGALAYCKEKAAKYICEAQELIKSSTLQEKEFLIDVADYIMTRVY